MTSNTNGNSNEVDANANDASTAVEKVRPSKRIKLETNEGGKLKNEAVATVPAVEEETEALPLCPSETEDNPKKKRHWESWDKIDKDVFFEGLAEFGKDFDKIYTYLKKKRREDAKNKQQIRHFYYRTWNKIAKGLPVEADKDKKGQHELFCLLCYGELRKKGVRGFGTSQMKKLDELIRGGLTVLRYKGRRWKVKPPNCKSLKRIQEQQLDGATGIVIPKKINIELSPRSTTAWCIARKLCCNPRLRCTGIPTKVWMVQLFLLLERKMKCYHPQYQATVPSIPLHIFASSSAAETQQSHLDNAPKSPKVLLFDSCGSLDTRSNDSTVEAKNDSIETIDQVCKADNATPQPTTSKEETIASLNIDNPPINEKSLWVKDNCAITIGSLYADLGKQENLELYYDWPVEPINSGLPESLKTLSQLAKCELQASAAKQAITNKRNSVNAQNVDPSTLISIASKSIAPPSLLPKHAFIVPSIPQDRLTLVNSCNNVRSSSATTDMLSFPKAHKRGRAPRNTATANVVTRTIIPRPITSKKLIPSAVAVNIVQQPAQLVQFPHLAQDKVYDAGREQLQKGIQNDEVNSVISNVETTIDDAARVSFAGLVSETVSVQVVDQGHAPSVAEMTTKSNKALSAAVCEAIPVSSSQPTTSTPTLLSDIDLSFLQNIQLASNKPALSTVENVNTSSQLTVPVHETSNDGIRTSSILTTPLKSLLETPTKIYDGSSSGSKSSPLKVPHLNFDQQWLGGEMSDLSLGSLLGGFSTDSSKLHHSTHGSTSGLDFILDENSVDYINRFREMTAKLTGDNSSSGSKMTNYSSGIATKTTANCVSNALLLNSSNRAVQGSDATLPICHSEDSSGPLDGLSFVLPSNDNNH